MRSVSRPNAFGLLMAVCVMSSTAAAVAAPLPARALASDADAAPIAIGDRWYRDLDDDDYYYPPEYVLPPPPMVRVMPAPPVAVYEPPTDYQPPVYGWLAPPRPASCGKYRYWDGERCADARYDPPYIGPRW